MQHLKLQATLGHAMSTKAPPAPVQDLAAGDVREAVEAAVAEARGENYQSVCVMLAAAGAFVACTGEKNRVCT